jgi:hypothetical protein
MPDKKIVNIPIDERDLATLEDYLRDADVFTTSFNELGDTVYKAGTYLAENLLHETKIIFLLDRNVFTRLIAIARARRSELDDAHRVAAAVLSFAQTVDGLVEPCMALHEYAFECGDEPATEELLLFRILDNTHPQLLANIALGREILDIRGLVGPPSEGHVKGLSRTLWRWNAHYLTTLKIAEIELKGASPQKKLLEFIDWMGKDFLFSAPSLLLAMHYLAPKGPKKRLMKALRSRDRNRALAGVRNAAWDLTLVSEWVHRLRTQAEEHCLWVLVSQDRGLHRLARSLLVSQSISSDEHLRYMFCELWGMPLGCHLCEKYREWIESRKNMNTLPELSSELAKQMQNDLEIAVREGLAR